MPYRHHDHDGDDAAMDLIRRSEARAARNLALVGGACLLAGMLLWYVSVLPRVLVIAKLSCLVGAGLLIASLVMIVRAN